MMGKESQVHDDEWDAEIDRDLYSQSSGPGTVQNFSPVVEKAQRQADDECYQQGTLEVRRIEDDATHPRDPFTHPGHGSMYSRSALALG